MREKWICICLLAIITVPMVQPVRAEVKVVELDNVWLQELKVMMEGGVWDGVGHSGIAKSWGYDNLGGGIYDGFSWFENGAHVVEGKHVVVMVDRQELDFWAGGEWCLLFGENTVRHFEPSLRALVDAYYPHQREYYLDLMENSVIYLDGAYSILKSLFGKPPGTFFTDDLGRLVILIILTKTTAGGFADYPITIRAHRWMEPEPSFVNYFLVYFHEIGHTFTGGGKYSGEWWAEFCAEFVLDNFGVTSHKEKVLDDLMIYEQLGAPFENITRNPIVLDNGKLLILGGVARGILFALGENLGYDKFENVRWEKGNLGNSQREDATLLMWQLYPAFGGAMWPFFENWNFPVNEDTDNDGLSNREEIEFGSFPFEGDVDSDNLSDKEEQMYGTDPWDFDTDNDYVRDGIEVKLYASNPLDNDTDGDGLIDGHEVWNYHTSPILYDSDNDGVSDYDEIYEPRPPSADYTWLFQWFMTWITILVPTLALYVLKLSRRR